MFKRPAKSRNSFQIPLKYTAAIATDGSGTLSQDFSPDGVTSAGNWTNLTGLYDTFSVKAMKIRLIPRYMSATSETITNYHRGTALTCVDWDGTGLPTTVAQVLQYGNMKYRDPSKPFNMYVRIPKKYRPVMNDMATGFNTTDNKNVKIVLFGDAWSASVQAYFYVITYYVTCYGLR